MTQAEEQEPLEDQNYQSSRESSDNPSADNSYLKLRRLVLGDEYSSALKAYVAKEDEVERVSEALPDALKQSSQEALSDALAPVIDKAIGVSIEQNPKRITDILFPIMGPAIRKAVASALAEMVQSLNTLLEQSLTLGSLTWRIRAWRAGMPYAQYVLLETIQYRVEQVLLVHRETGLLLHSIVAEEVEAQDPELVSSMLSAISEFVSDSFSGGQETLERIRFGDLELQMLVGPHAILAVAVRGQATDELALKANRTIEKIHAEFSSELTKFEGDRSEFEKSSPILSECLLTQKAAPKKKRKPWLAIAMLLAAAFYFASSAYQEWQLNEAFRILETRVGDEPGYLILSSWRQDQSLYVKVLRDPGSRSPKVAQRELMSSKNITLHIEDTVVHFGPLPEPVVEEKTPEQAFLDLVASLQSTSFYFEANAWQLSEQELEKIPALVEKMAELERSAQKQGFIDLQLIVMGFADHSGSSTQNIAISQQRSNYIKDILQANGVSSDILVAWGAGSIDRAGISDEKQRRATLQVLYSVRPGKNKMDQLEKAGDAL